MFFFQFAVLWHVGLGLFERTCSYIYYLSDFFFFKPNECFFDSVRRNFSDSHSKSLQITEDETLAGPLSGSYVSLFVEQKNLVLVSCVFWQRQSDLFVSHISTTMQSLLVFRRLILGGFVKQTQPAFWSLLFL